MPTSRKAGAKGPARSDRIPLAPTEPRCEPSRRGSAAETCARALAAIVKRSLIADYTAAEPPEFEACTPLCAGYVDVRRLRIGRRFTERATIDGGVTASLLPGDYFHAGRAKAEALEYLAGRGFLASALYGADGACHARDVVRDVVGGDFVDDPAMYAALVLWHVRQFELCSEQIAAGRTDYWKRAAGHAYAIGRFSGLRHVYAVLSSNKGGRPKLSAVHAEWARRVDALKKSRPMLTARERYEDLAEEWAAEGHTPVKWTAIRDAISNLRREKRLAQGEPPKRAKPRAK